MQKEFEIKLPEEFEIGDYIQTTEKYENLFNKSIFARIYKINKSRELIYYVTRQGNKDAINEMWIKKVA